MIRPIPLWDIAESLGGVKFLRFVFHGYFVMACKKKKLFKEKIKSDFYVLINWFYPPILSLLKSHPDFLFYFEKLRMKEDPWYWTLLSARALQMRKCVLRILFQVIYLTGNSSDFPEN